ncbi:CBS domain-containing protein [Brunnivagina elsteri]|uniref:histidine kinase n=1 Tax=Brunnivagina elsteri CCALA 953 TaxID=987040 RepID=A0A2A2TK10_9CYAN|nr:CBS domain-containing protein [Calothrix elsteri]PAX56142.1 hypothetical protein CK510_10585 [Calothrix elsteri CCALA 953]
MTLFDVENTYTSNSLADLPALEQVMDSSPLMVAPDTLLAEVIHLMSQVRGSNCSVSLDISTNSSSESFQKSDFVLVVVEKQLLGIVTERDIVKLAAYGINLSQLTVAEVMTRSLITLTQSNTQNVLTALALLNQHGIRHLPVLDGDGELLGVVTYNSIRHVLQPVNLLEMRRVGEVMNTQTVHAPKSASLLSLARLMNDRNVSCVAIAEPRSETCHLEPIGIVTERDIVQFQALELDLETIQAETVMSSPLFCLSSENSLWVAHQKMQAHWVRRLVVTGSEGEFLGIITQDNLLQLLDPVEMASAIAILQQKVEGKTAQLTQINQSLLTEMAQRQQLEVNLQTANEELELRVQERTAELSQANRLLQEEIQERQQIEKSLRSSELSYRTLAENLPAIVYRLFPADNNRMVFFNNMLQHCFGYEWDNLQQGEVCSIEHLIISEDKPQVIVTVKDAIAKNQPFEIEYRLRDRGGEIHYCWEKGKPIYDTDGQLLQIDGVIFDITEKKQLEQQFYHAQRLESLGTLASGIAHDLNNILTPILAVAQLLPLKIKSLDESSQKLLKMQEVNAKRAAELVQQILSFARGDGGKRSFIEIQQLLLDIEQIVKGTFPKTIAIATDISDNLSTVFADGNQLHQIFMNLLVNARDAMPDGGTLTIAADNLLIDENYAKMNMEAKVGAYVVITITDTGIGIPPEIIDRIFDPFFTTKDLGKGTGLGLSSTIGIVKNHDGFITVRSELGKGSRFQVYLPATNGTISQPPENQEIPTGRGELILLVDDEAVIIETTKATLETYNYRILAARDGIDAIAIYAQYKNEISVVLIDMMMPLMDGENTINTLLKLNSQVKIIAMSGLISTEVMAKVARTGVKQFLAKPFTAQEVLNCLHSLLSQR